jgi:hypothetical protein
MLYEPIFTEEGQHLGSSRKVSGAVSGNAYDDSGLVGPAAWREVPEREGAEDTPDLTATVLMAIGIAGTLAAVKFAPYVKSRWNDIKSKRNRSSDTSEADSLASTAEIAALSSTSPADFSTEVCAALEEHRIGMSSAEAQKRLIMLLQAAAFVADQMRTLSNARIDDDDASLELAGAMDKLTAPQIADGINRMLESNASLLDEETSAELMRIFGEGQRVDGLYVPLRHDKIKAALRLTDREM